MSRCAEIYLMCKRNIKLLSNIFSRVTPEILKEPIGHPKPKMKVIVRNGVEVFITRDNRKQW